MQHIMASRYVVAQQMRLEDAVVTPSADPARTFAATCVSNSHVLDLFVHALSSRSLSPQYAGLLFTASCASLLA